MLNNLTLYLAKCSVLLQFSMASRFHYQYQVLVILNQL